MLNDSDGWQRDGAIGCFSSQKPAGATSISFLAHLKLSPQNDKWKFDHIAQLVWMNRERFLTNTFRSGCCKIAIIASNFSQPFTMIIDRSWYCQTMLVPSKDRHLIIEPQQPIDRCNKRFVAVRHRETIDVFHHNFCLFDCLLCVCFRSVSAIVCRIIVIVGSSFN